MANLLAPVAPELCGIIRQRYTRCGKTNCRCRQGHLHGPYYVLQYRIYRPGKGWVKASKYVQENDLEPLRAELLSARQYTKAEIRRKYKELKETIRQFRCYIEEE